MLPKRYWVWLFLVLVFGLYSLNNAAYFAWITASQPPPVKLRSAQLHFYAWSGVLLLSLVVFITICVWMLRFTRRSQHSDVA
jgi:hypothetical protein